MHTGYRQEYCQQCLRDRSGVHFLAAAAGAAAGTHRVTLDDVPYLIVSVEQRHGTARDKCM